MVQSEVRAEQMVRLLDAESQVSSASQDLVPGSRSILPTFIQTHFTSASSSPGVRGHREGPAPCIEPRESQGKKRLLSSTTIISLCTTALSGPGTEPSFPDSRQPPTPRSLEQRMFGNISWSRESAELLTAFV